MPSCVVFANRVSGEQPTRQIGPGGIKGLSLSGRLPRSQIHWEEAKERIAAAKTTWFFDHPFVVDHKTYWCECVSEAEAHYLSAYINSGYANEQIKEFQSRGLFGPRDVHKLIVKLPFPRFQKTDISHQALSALGKACADLADNFVVASKLSDLPPI